LVKLIQPIGEKISIDPTQILITSYTHPEYSLSMRSTLTLTKANALLLRGCEGEPVADARRSPAYALIEKGHVLMSIEGEKGSISGFSNFNEELNASGIANYSKQIVDGKLPAPQSILDQIGLIKKLAYTSKI
jgi:anthranilate phosphoribosyltransferase